jgi:TRAP-type mannitol/chloroaromatic compound transport system substrate-binding protein
MRSKQARASRRRFLAGAGTALAGFPMVSAAQSPLVLRFQGAWPAADLHHEHALDYAKKFNEMAGGRARIEVLAAGAIVKPQELLDAVEKGVLDGCHAQPSYWARKDAAFTLFGSGPALGLDAGLLLSWMEYGGGRELYEEVYARLLYRNVTGFLYGALPPPPLGWFRKPLASAAQLKGMRYGASGPAAEIARLLGASIEEAAGEDAARAARTGVLDAAASADPARDRQLSLPETLPVLMLQSFHQPAPVFEVLFSRKRYEALPAELRAVARYAAQASSADVQWKSADQHSTEHVALRARKTARLARTPDDVLRAQLKAWSAVAARHSRDNPHYEKILKSQQAWARRIVRWRLDTTADPRIAYDHWFAGPAGGAGRP